MEEAFNSKEEEYGRHCSPEIAEPQRRMGEVLEYMVEQHQNGSDEFEVETAQNALSVHCQADSPLDLQGSNWHN